MVSFVSRIVGHKAWTLPAVGMVMMSVAACANAQAGHDHSGATEAAAHAAGVHGAAPQARSVQANVIGLDGASLGTVSLQETPAGVLVVANVSGIPEGEHGFHFHQKGICDTATKFDSAGGHFAAGDTHHGFLTPQGPHGGDMPNQYVGKDGVLKTQVLNTGVSFDPGVKSLFDADGTALVIHAGKDDYQSQPAGNAGPRLACAVIAKPQ